jgi:hypothetical protein
VTKARPAPGADLGSRDGHPISSCEVRDGRRAMTSPSRSRGPQIVEEPEDPGCAQGAPSGRAGIGLGAVGFRADRMTL